MNQPFDPFEIARQSAGTCPMRYGQEQILSLLRHADVREAAKDWKTYSSDAPFQVPIPSEEALRSVRQLPIEVDPPVHKEYREIVDPYFRQPKEPAFMESISKLVHRLLDEACAHECVEVVKDFSLPLQSRALALLLKLPQEEAEFWISWGVNALYNEGEGNEAEGSKNKGQALDDYIRGQLDRAEAEPGDDIFSALVQAEFQGRPLTRDEMVGFINLTFAGGRETVIDTVSYILHFAATHPAEMQYLRDDPRRIVLASEEIFRIISPVTHLGRVCPAGAQVLGEQVSAGQRVSLNWASANYDESVFNDPHTLRLDRKPNPHVAFGFGTHLCLGAAHARLIARTLLQILCERNIRITVREAVPKVEPNQDFVREIGFAKLVLSLTQH